MTRVGVTRAACRPSGLEGRPATRSLTATLPDDMVEEIDARVAAGEYASASEPVRIEIEGSIAGDTELDDRLRDVVVPRCRARATAPLPLGPAEEVLSRVEGRYAAKRR